MIATKLTGNPIMLKWQSSAKYRSDFDETRAHLFKIIYWMLQAIHEGCAAAYILHSGFTLA